MSQLPPHRPKSGQYLHVNWHPPKILFLVLGVILISQCIPRRPKEFILPIAAPERLVPVILGESAGTTVPGRVRIVLADDLWKKEFKPEPTDSLPNGIERLNMTPELTRVFRCYGLTRVWRSMSQLEQPINGQFRVVTYAEWAKKRRQERGMRKNARPYDPPALLQTQATFELKFPDESDLETLLRELRKVPGVISAEVVVEPFPQTYFPQDPGWVDLSDPIYDATLTRGRWGFHNTGSDLGSDYLADFDIDLPEAWQLQRGSPEVVVAVLDNGVDVTHEDLYLNIFLNNGEVPASVVNAYKGASIEDGLPNELTFYDLNVSSVVTDLAAQGWTNINGNDYIDGEDVTSWWGDSFDIDGDANPDDDGNGYPDDLVGWDFIAGNNRPFELGLGTHGTPVSGLIAAVANNGIGIAGAAHKVRILPVRSVFDIAEIVYAIDFHAVRVINHSQSYWYGNSLSETSSIFSTLEPEGVVYVASLGNGNSFYYGADPSRWEEVVSVSNFDSDGRRNTPRGSGYGPKTDVAAPGTGMSSLSARTASAPGGIYPSFGGTSAASPITAGVAALIACHDAIITPEQIRQVLRMTAEDPVPVPDDRGENTPGWDLYSGWGLVNAYNAVSEVSSGNIHPEANIISLRANYRNRYRNEEFSIQNGAVPINAYMGLPNGGNVDWTLRRSPNWDLSGAVIEASQSNSSYSDGTTTLHTVNTDMLDQGRHVLELEVVSQNGVVSKDRAVIDLPRAYIANIKSYDLIITNKPIQGFAYGPGFDHYSIQIASGWAPASNDFIEIHSSPIQQAPVLGIYAQWGLLEEQVLMPDLDLAGIPFEGEVTLRLVTMGNSTWITDEKIIIDTQPALKDGFPLSTGLAVATSAPLVLDIDADGLSEIILAGYEYPQGKIKIFTTDATPELERTINLPSNEIIYHPITAGDVDRDGFPELVVRTMGGETNIRIYNHNGTEIQNGGWPLSFYRGESREYYPYRMPAAPVLADMTLDGNLDILVTIPKNSPEVPLPRIVAYDIEGNELYRYEANALNLLTHPAVGDIDGDGEPEVVAVAYPGYNIDDAFLFTWDANGTPKWNRQIRTSEYANARAPVLMDIDGDAQTLEIIAASDGGPVRVYDGQGNLLSRAC